MYLNGRALDFQSNHGSSILPTCSNFKNICAVATGRGGYSYTLPSAEFNSLTAYQFNIENERMAEWLRRRLANPDTRVQFSLRSPHIMKYYIHNEKFIDQEWEWFLLGDSKGVYVRYCVHNTQIEDLQTKGYIADTLWSKNLLENNEVNKDQWEAVLFTRYL